MSIQLQNKPCSKCHMHQLCVQKFIDVSSQTPPKHNFCGGARLKNFQNPLDCWNRIVHLAGMVTTVENQGSQQGQPTAFNFRDFPRFILSGASTHLMYCGT